MTASERPYNGDRIISSINGVGEIKQSHGEKNKARRLSNTIHKNQSKMDKRLKCEI